MNGIVGKDGASLFENKDADTEGFLLSVYRHFQFNYPKFHKMDHLCKLGWLAAEILLKDSFTKDDYRPEETGIILANANSSLDNDLKYFETLKEFASPSLFVYTLPNIVIGEICIRHHFKGEQVFFVAEHFDPVFVDQYISTLMNKQLIRACICGWVDVLGGDYKTVLFLVEQHQQKQPVLFSAKNMADVFGKLNYLKY
ncbi:hypothetical protein [uncultured Mucilaginibacter sp.]|uniref:hypothetical protein n=1 Tax=uncultured Mucilaginibacter sp. TaxID=797541 RepID=UPI0025DB97E1|nr:hypothetical protein [uncultured Mucilaginibacter sp.]